MPSLRGGGQDLDLRLRCLDGTSLCLYSLKNTHVPTKRRYKYIMYKVGTWFNMEHV